MKDVSQCLLSIIDEFEKYHSQIVSLEDANQSYDKNVKTLKSSRNQLIQSKQDNAIALKTKEDELNRLLLEHKKLQARYKYSKVVIEELRDENAHMNADVLSLKDDNEKHTARIQRMKQDLVVSKNNEVKDPQNIVHLFSKVENLKTKLQLSQQELSRLSEVQEENLQLKLRYEQMVQEKLNNSSHLRKLHEQYIKMQKEKNNAYEKMKHLEFEFKDLSERYKSVSHDKELLKKKTEDLILEKYNKMYETKHIFGIDMDTVRGQNNYIDIDSLIENIDASKPPVPIKALA
ncbi:MAG: hypothetical protein COA44_07800 [Arcobacter sp.]|nr:MAG: hypothetical protein COA44_07800 [Arcobacter sp.]